MILKIPGESRTSSIILPYLSLKIHLPFPPVNSLPPSSKRDRSEIRRRIIVPWFRWHDKKSSSGTLFSIKCSSSCFHRFHMRSNMSKPSESVAVALYNSLFVASVPTSRATSDLWISLGSWRWAIPTFPVQSLTHFATVVDDHLDGITNRQLVSTPNFYMQCICPFQSLATLQASWWSVTTTASSCSALNFRFIFVRHSLN